MKFQHQAALSKDAPCPNCGQDASGHVTEADDDHNVGRRCLGCGYTWPIRLEVDRIASVTKAMNVIIYSEQLSKDDIQRLLQAIRDCEQQHFPSKEIGIYVFVPELTCEECSDMLQSIVPPFQHGPLAMAFGGKEPHTEEKGEAPDGSPPDEEHGH